MSYFYKLKKVTIVLLIVILLLKYLIILIQKNLEIFFYIKIFLYIQY